MPRKRKIVGETEWVERITANHVENAPPAAPGERYRIWETRLPGFALLVTESGHTSFVVVRRIGKGGNPVSRKIQKVGLSEARKEAERFIDWMREGKDPTAELAREQEVAQAAQQAAERTKGNTFAVRWALYDQHHIAEKRPLTQKEMRRPYRMYFQPELGDRPLHEIKRADISVMLMGIPKKVAATGPQRHPGVSKVVLGPGIHRGRPDAAEAAAQEGREGAGADADRCRVGGHLERSRQARIPARGLGAPSHGHRSAPH